MDKPSKSRGNPSIHIHLARRYGPLGGPTSSSCGGLLPGFFLPFGQKKDLIMLFWPILSRFWCSVVNLVTPSKITKSPKKIHKKNLKNPKKLKNGQNSKNIEKFIKISKNHFHNFFLPKKKYYSLSFQY